jgi:hypothetical protein
MHFVFVKRGVKRNMNYLVVQQWFINDGDIIKQNVATSQRRHYNIMRLCLTHFVPTYIYV